MIEAYRPDLRPEHQEVLANISDPELLEDLHEAWRILQTARNLEAREKVPALTERLSGYLQDWDERFRDGDVDAGRCLLLYRLK